MELKKEVESLLFSSGKAMSITELAELTNGSEKEVKQSLKELSQEYDSRDTSLMLVETKRGWQLNVREKYMDLVTKIVADTELPFPVLETLAVIAYKAPVMQADIIKIRGTNAYEQIGELVEQDFVVKKKEGRSFRLSLTPKFFKYFDVEGEQDIKAALQNARQPEKKPEKKEKQEKLSSKLGKLKVVDVKEEDEKTSGIEKDERHKLGDLEIVDEPEESQEKEEPFTADTNLPDNDFLNELDSRINQLSGRNDENDQDQLLKRRAGSDEEQAEGEALDSEKKEQEKSLQDEIADIKSGLEEEKKHIMSGEGEAQNKDSDNSEEDNDNNESDGEKPYQS